MHPAGRRPIAASRARRPIRRRRDDGRSLRRHRRGPARRPLRASGPCLRPARRSHPRAAAASSPRSLVRGSATTLRKGANATPFRPALAEMRNTPQPSSRAASSASDMSRDFPTPGRPLTTTPAGGRRRRALRRNSSSSSRPISGQPKDPPARGCGAGSLGAIEVSSPLGGRMVRSAPTKGGGWAELRCLAGGPVRRPHVLAWDLAAPEPKGLGLEMQ